MHTSTDKVSRKQLLITVLFLLYIHISSPHVYRKGVDKEKETNEKNVQSVFYRSVLLIFLMIVGYADLFFITLCLRSCLLFISMLLFILLLMNTYLSHLYNICGIFIFFLSLYIHALLNKNYHRRLSKC
jgi:hypothetical protein